MNGVTGTLNIFNWIEQHLKPEPSTTDAMIYDDMESQSDCSLIGIYRPFDGTKRSHWSERGSVLDFLCATGGEGRRLLDFGPGDGWPSLLLAPYALEVVGLDSSRKRVQVCRTNAQRMGINNAWFQRYRTADPIPFPAESFDGVIAASSIEQTPDPKEILAEIHRILRPGGRLRIFYEGLAGYRGESERDLAILEKGRAACKMLLYDRDIARERVIQYAIDLQVSKSDLLERLGTDRPEYSNLTVEILQRIEPMIERTRVVETIHPSGQTWVRWLGQVGFRSVRPTHDGSRGAVVMYDRLTGPNRPMDVGDVDDMIRPAVELAVNLECPLHRDPRITATK